MIQNDFKVENSIKIFSPGSSQPPLGRATLDDHRTTAQLTSDVQVVEVDALRDQLEDPDVGDVDAAFDFQMAQLGAPAPDQRQPAVRQAGAAVEDHLRGEAEVSGARGGWGGRGGAVYEGRRRPRNRREMR